MARLVSGKELQETYGFDSEDLEKIKKLFVIFKPIDYNIKTIKERENEKAVNSKEKGMDSKRANQGYVRKTSFIPKTVPQSRDYHSWADYHGKRHPGISG